MLKIGIRYDIFISLQFKMNLLEDYNMHLHFFNYLCFYLCPSVYESFKNNKELNVGIKICQKEIIFVCLDQMQELKIYATKNINFDELKKTIDSVLHSSERIS